jgi:DNA invertase Pin-like site-specific DNA recombinase
MRVVGYLRVSTERQADEGPDLEMQQQAIKGWAAAEGHKLVACYSDGGVSGANGIDARVGLHEALAALAVGRADGLVVGRLDRLAGDLWVQEGILAWVWKHGGRVFACDVGEVAQEHPDHPMRMAMRQMMGVFGQLERGMIAARMRAGRRRKAARGGFAYGAPPYGKRAVGGELVDDPAEQQVIARIRELHTGGVSLRQIARTLTAEGVRPRRGKRWQDRTVAKIVARLKGDLAD